MADFAELLFDELVEDLAREVCFPLHRELQGRITCLSCSTVSEADNDPWDVPLVGNDEFESKLVATMQQRAAKLADEIVSRAPGLDVFGTKPRTVATDNFKCSHCGKKVAANRFAKHLEGCMLGGGRVSARIADTSQGVKEPSPVAKRAKTTDSRASPMLSDAFADPGAADPSFFF